MRTILFRMSITLGVLWACSGTASVMAGHVILEPSSSVDVKVSEEKPVSAFCLQFDLSQIGDSMRLDGATLKLWCDVDGTLGEGVDVHVYAICDSWGQGAATSMTSPETVDTLMTLATMIRGQDRFVEFDVTEIAQRWYSGDLANRGLLVRAANGDGEEFRLSQSLSERVAELEVFFSKSE